MDFFEPFMQLPSMNPFPGPNSIMIVDNCSTHKSNAVRDAVEAAGLSRLSCFAPLVEN
jgi:hypothetical protein